MSYCRWSSHNFGCDVYVYADCAGGWTTHVAARKRIIPPIPEPNMLSFCINGGEWDKNKHAVVYRNKFDLIRAWIGIRIWMLLSKPHRWSMDLIPLQPIGLPHDGETFNDCTPQDCADTLEMLRNAGYRVPQYAIDTLREESEDKE